MERVRIPIKGKMISVLKGSNLPLFYIHGSGCDAEIWLRQLEEIGGYAIDLPNHGESEKTEIRSVEDYAEFVAEVVRRISGKGVIVGHSLGGAIAQVVYFKHSNVVRALVLLSTGARLRVLPELLEGLEKNPDEMVKMAANMAFAKKDFLKEYEEIFRKRAKILLEDLKICNKFDLLEDFRSGKLKFSVPTIAVVGERDVLTPVKYSQFFTNFGAELRVIKEVGHMVMLEAPDELNQIIREFLEKLS
ncbi:MAG: alpha/beta hydrolase [Archaeoglobaceae archaeon]